MSNTVWATVRNGKIEPVEPVELPEGSRILVTLLSDEESDFWLQASQTSLDAVWNNPEDEVYAVIERWSPTPPARAVRALKSRSKLGLCALVSLMPKTS